MKKNIVVAVDGSAASQTALEHAVALARQNRAALTGVFVVDAGRRDGIDNDTRSSAGIHQGLPDPIRAEQARQADAARAQFEKATSDLPAARFALLAGNPVDEIVKLAAEPTDDLLVLNQRVFQVSGRPNFKSLGRRLAERAQRPYVLFL